MVTNPVFRFATVRGQEVDWLLRRNCSATPMQVVGMYLSLCAVSLAIATGFWLQGAKLVLAFAGAELVAGADGVGEGIPASRAGEQVPKFHEDALMVVRAGGAAGLFSAILPGWLAGRSRTELQPVTKEITE